MENDDNECTWIALEAATRNVTALLRIRKENGAATEGSVKLGAAAVSAGLAASSADWKGDAPAVGLGEEATDALQSCEAKFADGERLVKRA